MLSLVDLCMASSLLSYQQIQQECGLKAGNLEEVESLVMDGYINQLIECRIDQRNRQVHILSVNATNGRGRDVSPEKLKKVIDNLKKWEATNLAESQAFFEEKVRKELDKSVLESHDSDKALQTQIEEMMNSLTKGPKPSKAGLQTFKPKK